MESATKALAAGNFSEAEDLFRQAAALSPSADAYENLALLEALAGNDAATEAACRKLLKFQPSNYNGYLLLALVYTNRSQFQNARSLLQSLNYDPDPLLQAVYYVALEHTGEREKAGKIHVALTNTAVAPQDALLAARLFRAPELKDMAAFWLKSASNNANGRILAQIGDAYARQADWEEAEKAYRQALKSLPDQVSLLLSLAAAEEKNDHHNEAIKHLEEAKNNLHSDGDRKAYALTCMQLHLMKEAAGVLNAGLERNGPDADVYFLLGVIQFYFGHYEQAKDCYNLALSLRPDDKRVRLALGYLWVETQEFDKALPELKAALGNTQLAGLAYHYLGLIEKAQGMLDAAARDLQQAAVLRPDDAMIKSDLGGVQISLGQLQAAKANIDAALRLDHRNAGARFQNARLLGKLGQRELAKTEIDRSEGMRLLEKERSAMQLAEVK